MRWRGWQNPTPTSIVRVYKCSGVFLGGSGLDTMARLADSYADIFLGGSGLDAMARLAESYADIDRKTWMQDGSEY